MIELTDLEICKRIAEIEGVNVTTRNMGGIVNSLYETCRVSPSGLREYNPLTDDALCFKLMNKHSVSLINHENTNGACYAIWAHSNEIPHPCSTQILTNPNKAICLAIIEAHEND